MSIPGLLAWNDWLFTDRNDLRSLVLPAGVVDRDGIADFFAEEGLSHRRFVADLFTAGIGFHGGNERELPVFIIVVVDRDHRPQPHLVGRNLFHVQRAGRSA